MVRVTFKPLSPLDPIFSKTVTRWTPKTPAKDPEPNRSDEDVEAERDPKADEIPERPREP